MIWGLVAACVAPGPWGVHPDAPEPFASPTIGDISLACKVDKDKWVLAVTATSWSGGGQSTWSEDGEYVEVHSVPVLSSAADGGSEELELELAIVSDWRAQSANVSTVFTCGDAPAVQFVLLDLDLHSVDCVMFEDPDAAPVALDCP